MTPLNHEFSFYLKTAAGKLVCKGCMAKSARTGAQCGRPALKESKRQKWQFHGNHIGAQYRRKPEELIQPKLPQQQLHAQIARVQQ